MSEYDDNDQGENIANLRAAAERGTAAGKERDAAIRELALLKAGVDTDSSVGKMFSKAYDGALDGDAIKSAWLEVAPAAAPAAEADPPEPPPVTTTTEGLEETAARRLLTSGGAGDHVNEQPPPDPIAEGYGEYHERMKNGEGREKAAGSVFGALLQAAANGDERAIWSGWTPEQIAQGK